LVNRISEGEEFLTGYEVLPHRDEDGEAAVVEILKVVDGTQVANAYRALGPEGFMVSVQLKKKGGDRMFEATGKNLGKPMAIIVDDEIVSVATIRDRFGDSFVITGDYDQQEAEQLSSFLKNPLAKPIEVINETYVSPAMGQETIKQGFTAGIAGLCLTLLFVLFYYNLPGIVATIGLLVNVIIIFGLLSMFQFVLTMPGIAGVILTIGISIDANVLIYERLREEQKAGKSLKAALESAYGKAFSAIFDANVTTLIAAFLLLALATGTIKGFATTLIIGIFGSLFAALLVTKVLFGWLLDLGVIKKVNLWSILAVTKIDFLSYRRTAAFVSLALVAGAIALISVKQENVLGVGMRGGDLVTIASTEDLSLKQLEDSLTKASGLKAKPSVQEQKPLNQSATFFTVRTADDDGPIALNHLRSDLDATLADTQIESVGSQVGEEMFRKSLLALGIGMIFILFYVTFRFESIAFALGAIAAVLHDLVVTIGILALLGQEISLIMVGALLTIAGYSINDTIVVFDRLREGLKTQRGEVIDVMNFCLNATLSRTIITSMTTLIVVLTLFFFGGPALKEFALTLIIGVLIGTYSSIFVASPIVLWWARTRKLNLRREMLDAEASKVVGPASAANT
ncbi:MAG: protein translocase subunit SecD, partial [Verrucomicrobiota bacterium]